MSDKDVLKSQNANIEEAADLSDDMKATIDAKELTDEQIENVAGGVVYFNPDHL